MLLQSELEATASHMRDEFQLHGSHAFHPLNPRAGLRYESESELGSDDALGSKLGSQPGSDDALGSKLGSQPGSDDAAVIGDIKVRYTGGVNMNRGKKHELDSATLDQDCSGYGSHSPLLSWGQEFDWLSHNPIGDIPTEREVYMRAELPGQQVYRFFLERH